MAEVIPFEIFKALRIKQEQKLQNIARVERRGKSGPAVVLAFAPKLAA